MLNRFKGFVESLVRLVQGGKATEAGKISNQSKDSGIELASYTWSAIYRLQALYEHDLYSSRVALLFISLKIDKIEKENPSTKNFAITKFCHLIVENVELYKELEILNNFAKDYDDTLDSTNYKKLCSQLSKVVTDFKLQNLADKVGFLGLLKEERDFTAIQKAYRDKWNFYDLMNDKDFKQTYIDKAVNELDESASEGFREGISKYVKLAEQGKKAASKYFGKEVNLKAHYTEIDNAYRVLNVNLIDNNGNEPTRISDILQQEKGIKELNIYCNKKHEIHAHQDKDKKRYYEFKEGAHYEMTSTWPVKDKSGNVSICTMIMNVGSDGITEVLKFNGEDFVPSEEILELIKQNRELYIQGLSLYDAVMKSLKKDNAVVLPDVVPTANNNLQNESIRVSQDKEPEGKSKVPDLECNTDNSSPPSSIKEIATQTEINSQQAETQTEVNSQHTETQTEIKSQHIETQTGVTSQQIGELKSEDQRLNKKLVEAKREIEELKKQLEEKEWEFEEGIGKIREGITQLKENLEEKEKELKNVHEEKRELRQELEVVNVGKEELEKELNHVQEEKSNLENELDQLERSNKEMNGNQEQLLQEVSNLKKRLSYLEEVNQKLSNELENVKEKKKEVNKEFVEAKREIEELENQNSNSQNKLEKKEREFKERICKMHEESTQLEENLKKKEKELEKVHKEKRKLEGKLQIVNAEKESLGTELNQTREYVEQIMVEQCQQEKRSKDQLGELEQKYEVQLESSVQEKNELTWKVEELTNELKLKDKQIKEERKQLQEEIEEEINELELGIKKREEEHEDGIDELKDIIVGKVQTIKGMKEVIKNSKNQVKYLEDLQNPVADKQKVDKIPNDRIKEFYILTGDISSEPYNAPLEKRNFTRSLSVDN